MRPQGFCALTNFSHRNAEYLKKTVDEMLAGLSINPLIIDRAHYLDMRATEEAIAFRLDDDGFRGPRPQRALILIATEEENKSLALKSYLQAIPEADTAWSERISTRLLQEDEFAQIFFKLTEDHLQAEIGSKVDLDTLITEFYTLTQGNWWFIEQLYTELNRTLRSSDGRRIITPAMVKQVKKLLTTERFRA